MPTLRSCHDSQAFLGRHFTSCNNAASAGRIHCHRFLHEYMLARVDCGLEMHGAEVGRRGQQDDVGFRLHDVFVATEPDEDSFRGNAIGLGSLPDTVCKDIGHGHSPDGDAQMFCRIHTILERAVAPSPTADQGDFEDFTCRFG